MNPAMALRLLMAGCVILLVGCGGGSGEGPASPTPPEPVPAPEPEPEPEEPVSLAGSIRTLPGAILDADTNNPDNPQGNNNLRETAQNITAPTTIGGYLQASSASTVNDDEDFYQISNAANYVITLFVADPEQADLDLTLYDEQGVVVSSSAGVTDTEQLTIPNGQTYYLGASAYEGGSNYTLSIGMTSTTASSKPQGSVIPHEVLVRYSAETLLNHDAAASNRRALTERFGLLELGGGLARLRRLRSLTQTFEAASTPNHRYVEAMTSRFVPDSDELAQWQTWMRVKAIKKQPGVADAVPNFRLRASAISNDTFSNYLWHYHQINLSAAWNTSTGDPGIVIAVIDTGIREHPDLNGQFVDGYDFIRNIDDAGDGDGLDPDPTDDRGSGSNDLRAGTFHGLHVIGTIAAIGNNERGIAGVAYSSKIMPLRALNSDGEGTSYDIIQALRYAAGLSNDSGRLPLKPAEVVNLSLGAGSFSDPEQDLFNQLRDLGVIVVAASGNDGVQQVDYPGAFASVIAVGATDAQSQLSSYSNSGAALDIVAPGGNLDADLNNDGQPDGILSTFYDDGPAYAFFEGTSMATPHVAGVVALMKSINPELDYQQFDTLLSLGLLTDDLGFEGRDNDYGWGQINAGKAVAAAIDSIGQEITRPAQLGVSADQLNFGSQLSMLTVVLSNLGGGELAISGAQSDAQWLSAEANNTERGLGAWIIRVDRSTLDEGRYNGTVTFTSNVNTQRLSVSMQVSTNTLGNMGTLYVLLVDPDTGDTVDQAIATFDNDYVFEFPSVDVGHYEVWAGSDNDNDSIICDAGEACGAFKTLDSPSLLLLDSNRDDISFSSNYQLRLSGASGASNPAVQPATDERLTKKRLQ